MIPPTVADTLFFDTETTGLNPWAPSTRCRGVGFLDGETGRHEYIDFDDGDLGRLEEFQNLLLAKPAIAAHNLHFDLAVLRRLGIELPPVENWHCTLTLARLAGPRLPEHGLKPLCVRLFNDSDDDEDQKLRAWAKANKVPVKERYAKAPQEMLSVYCLKDVYLLAKLYARIRGHLGKENVASAYSTEMLVLYRLLQAEERGQLLNMKHLKNVEVELAALATRQKDAIFGLAGGEFNVNASAQVAEALYGAGLPAMFTKTGKPGTSKFALMKVAKSSNEYQPAGSAIAKEMLKLRETLAFKKYCTGFRKYLRGNVLSCMFDALGAKTGRMSSRDPNLQNIPRPDEKGAALIRSLFVPRPGSVLLACDYSQIELRVIAMYAQDRRMLEILEGGGDIHTETAVAIFGSAGKPERQIAKSGNFLLGYGGTADKLINYLARFGRHLSLKEAREFVREYHAKFPGIAKLAQHCQGTVARTGGVTDVLGRFYPVPAHMAYASVNYLVQGTCAAILKKAIVRLGPALDEIGATMVSFIHDEIVIDTQDPGAEMLGRVREIMEERVSGITVSTPVEVSVCRVNWAKKESAEQKTA